MRLIASETGVLRGLQDTRTPLVVAVTGAVANAALNWLLVYPLDLGIAGSGLGTSLAQLGMAVALSRWWCAPPGATVRRRDPTPRHPVAATRRGAARRPHSVPAGDAAADGRRGRRPGDTELAGHQVVFTLPGRSPPSPSTPSRSPGRP